MHDILHMEYLHVKIAISVKDPNRHALINSFHSGTKWKRADALPKLLQTTSSKMLLIYLYDVLEPDTIFFYFY